MWVGEYYSNKPSTKPTNCSSPCMEGYIICGWVSTTAISLQQNPPTYYVSNCQQSMYGGIHNMWVGEYYSNKPSTKPTNCQQSMYGGIHNMWVGEYYSNKPSLLQYSPTHILCIPPYICWQVLLKAYCCSTHLPTYYVSLHTWTASSMEGYIICGWVSTVVLTYPHIMYPSIHGLLAVGRFG